jgi:hypothetical protein
MSAPHNFNESVIVAISVASMCFDQSGPSAVDYYQGISGRTATMSFLTYKPQCNSDDDDDSKLVMFRSNSSSNSKAGRQLPLPLSEFGVLGIK